MSHYFSEKQDSYLDIRKIDISVDGQNFQLYTGSGVFSKDRLDKGTELLIKNSVIPEKGRILDLGSGIGVVGITLKMMHPGLDVVMADVNERAVMLCKKNIKLHRLEGISAIKSNIFSDIHENFDAILLNPPQTAGKDICFSMIEGSSDHLIDGGFLQIVARHNKGGRSLSSKMEEVFGNVEDIAKSSGYRIYLSKKIKSL